MRTSSASGDWIVFPTKSDLCSTFFTLVPLTPPPPSICFESPLTAMTEINFSLKSQQLTHGEKMRPVKWTLSNSIPQGGLHLENTHGSDTCCWGDSEDIAEKATLDVYLNAYCLRCMCLVVNLKYLVKQEGYTCISKPILRLILKARSLTPMFIVSKVIL